MSAFTNINDVKRKYGVIYADPPWKFLCWSKKGLGRSAQAHFDCMRFERLAKLPVADMAARDCVLFLWVTDPMLPAGFDLIKAWGFEYKTVAFYWAKLNKKAQSETSYFMGGGYWTRANPEQCLLATRGRPKRLSCSVRKLVIDRLREHSRKPDIVPDRIEQLVAGPYLELFARETKPGWDCWGNQAGLFDHGSVGTRRWASSSPKKQLHSLHPDAGA
jgi:N6-adenosine-specific RNA methylase IME4